MSAAALVRTALGLALAAVLGACASRYQPPPAPLRAPSAVAVGLHDAAGAPIEALPFRQGVSSATVERLGKQQACVSREGAGLVTPQGPVEVYKMVCDSGRVFMARCELRQCRAM